MAGSVRVRRAGLGPGWGGSFDDISIRFTPSRPRADLRWLLEQAVDHLRTAVPAVGLSGVATLPRGSGVIAIAWCDTQADLDRLIDHLAAWLDQHDAPGLIDRYTASGPFYEGAVDKPPFDGVAVVISPRLRPDAIAIARRRKGDTFTFLHESIDPGALERVIDHALQWCEVPGGTHYLQSWLSSTMVAAEDRRALLVDNLPAAERLTLTCERWPAERRDVDFDVHGRVVYTVGTGSGDEDWPRWLHAAREVLAALADVAGYGFAVRAAAPSLGVERLLGPRHWPSLDDPDVDPSLRWFRLSEDTHVPEAFVTQLLSRHDLSAIDTSPWSIEPAGDRAVLLTSREPARWLAGERPEESVVRAARASLRPLLLTYENEQAHRAVITGLPPLSRPPSQPGP